MEPVSYTHLSNSIASTPIDSSASILLFSSDKDVVSIDEAQFFDEGLVDVCTVSYTHLDVYKRQVVLYVNKYC